ncbi:radical SAM protein, partial [Thermodesulfovibrionales bacterium]|nr:radical SAM protein [Thermodesulfovibrionales bacterium]
MIKFDENMDLIPYIDLLKLDKESWVVILPNKIIFLSDAAEDEINELIAKEKTELVKEIEKEKNEANKALAANITFLPTFDCNLRCIYCYARGGDERMYLTKELAKASIDAVTFETKASKINLHFAGGGEPFLNFDLMKFAVDYSRDLFHTVNIGLVTNATFNTEQLQWIVNNNIDLRISFDGLAQDHQRPPAEPFKNVIIKNIKRLSEMNYDFMVQCIITSKSVNNMVENVRYFSELGIKYLKIEPVHMSEICRGDESLIPKPKEFVDNFISMLKFIAEKALDIKIDS